MMRPVKLVCGMLAVAIVTITMQSAMAWEGPFGCDFHSRGYGVSGSLYGLGRVPVPPYFSLHPPVYYSVPVPRTYGYSPYAYPAEMVTPDVRPAPQEVLNPFVPQPAEGAEKKAKPEAKKTSGKVAAMPQFIANPYVTAPQAKIALHDR